MHSRKTLFRGVAFASALALGIAACGDNVVTVPEVPALSVSPPSLTLNPGQTGSIGVSVTGTTQTAFTVSSTDAAVATATATATGATVSVPAGAAPGSTASINIQVTGHPNLNASVPVTVGGTAVPPGETASVVIRSVTQALTTAPVNPNAVQGQIDVTLAVTRGDANTLQVSLVGAGGQRFVVDQCTQTFGSTGTAADGLITAADLRVAQNNIDIVCSINTAAASAAGVPAFPNAGYRVEARLLRGQDVLDAAQTAQLTFVNVDRVDLDVSPATTAISPATGLEWNTGAVTVTAVPVSFSGATVSRVTVTANLLNAGTVSRTDDDAAGGFSVTFPTSGANSIPATTDSIQFTATSVTAAGAVGPALTAANAETIRYDRVAPTGGTTPPFTNQWVNATTNILADVANWADAGVGGVTRTLFFSTNLSHTATQVVSAGQQVPEDRATLESDVSNAYQLAVRICDALNNCRNELIGSFGVDVTPPTLAVLAGSPANLAVNPGANYQFSVADTRSGPAAEQLRVRLLRSGPGISGAATCAIGSFANNTCSPVNINGPVAIPGGDEGYYELTVQGRDAAGNLSETTVTRLALRDITAPTVSNVAIPASLVGGQAATFTATATDNLDLARASFRLEFGALELPLEADQTLGTFGEPLTLTANLSSTATFVRAVELATGGTPDGSFELASAARFRVWDLANNPATQANAFAAGTVTRPGTAIASFAALGVQTFEMNTATTTIWRNPTGAQAGSATLRAQAVGPTGTFGNPFTRIAFYRTIGGVHFLVGEGAATATDTGANRIWTFTGPVIQGSNFPVGTLDFFAVGYTTQGDGLVSEAQTITVSEN